MPLELLFPNHTAYRVYDEFDEGCIDREGDFLHVYASLPEDNWLYSFLLSFGKDVTVISPEHVKINLKNQIT